MNKKKTVSIIGTCVTKEIFNEARLSSVFDVEVFAFKVCPFTILDNSINIESRYIFESPIAESQAKNFNYNVNKTLLEDIERVKSDFIFIDLFSLANDSLYELEFNGKKTIVQMDWYKKIFDTINDTLKKNNLSMKSNLVSIYNIDDTKILDGLKSFADYLSANFKNIFIVWPCFAKKYFNFDYTLKDYSENTLQSLNKKQGIIDKYTEYFSSLIPSAKVLKWKEDYIARFINQDYIKLNNGELPEPNPVHLIQENYEDLASNLLEILNLDYKEYYNKPLDYHTFKIETVKNEYEKLRNFRDSNIDRALCHINAYTNFLKTRDHHIIVFVGKGDISKNLRFWRNKNTLGIKNNNLKWKVEQNENYIALIDTKNNFICEKHSLDEVSLEYQIPHSVKNIILKSNKGSAIINFFNKDYSYNEQGLNFFVLNLNNGTIEDFGVCNINKDQFMLVESEIFNKFKTK